MAITLDTTLGAGPSAGATSYTQSMTLAGSNSYLVVGSFNNNNISTMSATWNGVAMTKVCSSTDGIIYTYLFALANPDLGTHDVVVSTNGGSTNIWIYAANFNGLANSAAEANSATNGNSGTNTNTVTTIADNALHVSLFANQNGNAQTVGAGTQAVVTDGGATHGLYASSPYAVTPAGSNSLSVTHTSSLWTNAGASFAPVVASTPTIKSGSLALMGCGM